MKGFMLAAMGLALAGLCGCVRTYHVEQSSYQSAAIATDGNASCSTQTNRDERQWTGPWVGQPDRVRP
jgi:hypothetical protein